MLIPVNSIEIEIYKNIGTYFDNFLDLRFPASEAFHNVVFASLGCPGPLIDSTLCPWNTNTDAHVDNAPLRYRVCDKMLNKQQPLHVMSLGPPGLPLCAPCSSRNTAQSTCKTQRRIKREIDTYHNQN